MLRTIGTGALVLALAAAGCRHACKRQPVSPAPLNVAPGSIPVVPPAAPGAAGQPFLGAPLPAPLPPGAAAPAAPEVLLPEPLPPDAPPAGAGPAPEPPAISEGVRLGEPTEPPAPGPTETVRLYPPDPDVEPRRPLTDPPAVARAQDDEDASDASDPIPPPVARPRDSPSDPPRLSIPSPSLPVGIPGFSPVAEGIATGLRPDLDGLEWLRENGYRTVLHLRRPDEEATADRRLIERKGLRYVGITVDADAFDPAAIEAFNRVAADASARPLFVYDRDGVLSGSLWYAHFRTAGGLPEGEARLRAGRLGLKEQGNAEQAALWVTIQRHLQGR